MFVPNFMKISLSVIKIKLLTDDGRKVTTIAYGLSAGKLKTAGDIGPYNVPVKL